ncbi:hypothetical protein BO82DRAFT_395087 [Aspergillus uvarum CBS 121591]|uniref:Uncharacterized protein n=1 Tax=Aspergillus uvarum CBS 121591 TaxID=1448315 RepID=A0A319CH33_9EURO|nr:hypothetical protein BO82DRAFT_395087 [Aspergillus uvarum CBS 121591]PYH77933.1 hypothetical protein BO82DRAFT_395087 [Aspergillus uvarum CBS 121591]
MGDGGEGGGCGDAGVEVEEEDEEEEEEEEEEGERAIWIGGWSRVSTFTAAWARDSNAWSYPTEIDRPYICINEYRTSTEYSMLVSVRNSKVVHGMVEILPLVPYQYPKRWLIISMLAREKDQNGL